MSALIGLQCHLCKTPFPAEAVYVCDRCLGPLEPVYDYDAVRLTRETIEARPKNLWRYRELLPITGEPRTGFNSGFTPLVRCLDSKLWSTVFSYLEPIHTSKFRAPRST